MKKIHWLMLIIFGLFSCGQKSKNTNKDQNIALGLEGKTIKYQSSNNGMADIQLKLLPDRQLSFFMEIIPQPKTEEHSELIRSDGHWNKTDDTFTLIFERKDLMLKSLFDESFDASNTFLVVNDSTVSISAASEEVWIWGVHCERSIY